MTNFSQPLALNAAHRPRSGKAAGLGYLKAAVFTFVGALPLQPGLYHRHATDTIRFL
jgi:hypothetical protein